MLHRSILRSGRTGSAGADGIFHDEFTNPGAPILLDSSRLPDTVNSGYPYKELVSYGSGLFSASTNAGDKITVNTDTGYAEAATATVGAAIELGTLTDFALEAQFTNIPDNNYNAIGIHGISHASAVWPLYNLSVGGSWVKAFERANVQKYGQYKGSTGGAPIMRIDYNPSDSEVRFYWNGALQYTETSVLTEAGPLVACISLYQLGVRCLYWKVEELS